MDITDVSSRRETLNSRYASNRKDANNSTGMRRDTNSSREVRKTPVMRNFAKNSSEWQNLVKKYETSKNRPF
jgi:hypothetical protein